VQGEAWLTVMSNSFARNWANEGVPVGYAIPKEGHIAFPMFFQIVNGSTQEQIDVASDIINIYLEPTTLSRYCNITKTIPLSKKAILSDELKNDPAFSQEASEGAMLLDWDTMAERDSEWKDRWLREVKNVMA
jgi:putative spermidine/putrescine transport system substrate-binding protein